jgi:major intracellular serine protease
MKKYKNPVKLPPFDVKHVVSTLSQTIDWGLMNLKIPDTWAITKGKGITVLIIDTGCPAVKSNGEIIVHPDLQGAVDVSKCKTFISDEGIEDLQGHNSHCAGIVGARNNDIGCVGYAPECTIVTYKGLDKDGSGSMEQITAALNYAADILKPDIISMSLGSTSPDLKMHQAIKRLYSMNIPIIAAGGNGGVIEGVNYPGNYDEVITIGAYDKKNNIADFSAVGEGIDFAFPGVEIYSTYLNGGYAKLSGTCLRGDTVIYTPTGSTLIKNIKVGDSVYCLDEKDLVIKEDKCIGVKDNGFKQLFKLTTDNNTIYATDNHPFLVFDQKFIWKQLKYLKENDTLCAVNYIESIVKYEKILNIELSNIEKVYDITVKNNHNFIADGLIVHNSMATPAAAGVVALLLAKHKKQEEETGMNDCKTVEQIKEHLRKYSIDFGKVGKDDKFGYGIVDVSKMIITPESISSPIEIAPPSVPVKKNYWQKFIGWIRNWL